MLFAVVADFLERRGVGPDALTAGTLPQVGVADDHRVQAHAAARTERGRSRGPFPPVRFGAAMRAKLGPQKHHSKTGRTRHRGEPRPAVIAAR